MTVGATDQAERRAPVLIGEDGKPVVLTEHAVNIGRIELHDLRAVRKEMSKVYRAVRRGELSSAEGCRLTFMLSSIGRLIEASDIEQRLKALEEQQ